MNYFDKLKKSIEDKTEKLKSGFEEQTEKIQNNLEEQTSKFKDNIDVQKDKIKSGIENRTENVKVGKLKRKSKNPEKKLKQKNKVNNQFKADKRKKILVGVFILFITLGIIGVLTDDDPENGKKNENPVAAVDKDKDKTELAEKEAEELAEKEAEELAQKQAQEKSDSIKLIYNNAVGKTPIETSKNLEEHNFEVKFIHEITNMDFTSSIEFNSDPEDQESYIPFIITKLDSFDEDDKLAIFYINTQENIAVEEGNKNTEDTLSAKLSPSVAWGALTIYGEREFPYGFKLNIGTGMLAETAIDENTWFLKSKCQVKNSNGVWNKQLECEAEISGSNDAPVVNNFKYY